MKFSLTLSNGFRLATAPLPGGFGAPAGVSVLVCVTPGNPPGTYAAVLNGIESHNFERALADLPLSPDAYREALALIAGSTSVPDFQVRSFNSLDWRTWPGANNFANGGEPLIVDMDLPEGFTLEGISCSGFSLLGDGEGCEAIFFVAGADNEVMVYDLVRGGQTPETARATLEKVVREFYLGSIPSGWERTH